MSWLLLVLRLAQLCKKSFTNEDSKSFIVGKTKIDIVGGKYVLGAAVAD